VRDVLVAEQLLIDARPDAASSQQADAEAAQSAVTLRKNNMK
jgi:hypothetical protein